MKKKILVLGGCGAMGSEATRDLSQTSPFEEIVIADIDQEKANAFARSLKDPRLRVERLDVNDSKTLTELLKRFDIVLNCTTYKFGLIITEAAIAARVPLLDLGGLYNTPKQLAMTDRAKEAGITIVLGCGATPGVTNLMVREAANHMDIPEEVEISFGSFRSIAPSMGLMDTMLDEFSPGTTRFYYEDGKFVETPPFSGKKEIEFAPPIGKIPAYYVPHSETHTIPKFVKGVRRVCVRGTWRPETMEALATFKEFHLLSEEPLKGSGISPKQFLRELIMERSSGVDDLEWAFLLNVQVTGQKGQSRICATYNLSHPGKDRWNTSATARVTGIPASIGAQLLSQKSDYPHGVLAPEACFKPQDFFDELKKRDLHIHERIVATRSI